MLESTQVARTRVERGLARLQTLGSPAGPPTCSWPVISPGPDCRRRFRRRHGRSGFRSVQPGPILGSSRRRSASLRCGRGARSGGSRRGGDERAGAAKAGAAPFRAADVGACRPILVRRSLLRSRDTDSGAIAEALARRARLLCRRLDRITRFDTTMDRGETTSAGARSAGAGFQHSSSDEAAFC